MRIFLSKNPFLSAFVATFLVVLLINQFPFFENLELKTLDFRFQHFSRPELVDTNIVILTIDQKSIDFLDDNGIRWPWPREIYVPVLDFLTDAGAKAVGFDIDFSQQSASQLEISGQEADLALADAIQHLPVAFSALLFKGSELKISGNKVDERFFLSIPSIPKTTNYDQILAPLASFQESVSSIGVINLPLDIDGNVRHVPLSFAVQGHVLPAFSVALHQLYVDNAQHQAINLTGTHPVYWYGPGGPDVSFPYISISAVIAASYNEPDPQLLALFKDKIVLIGSNAPGLFDFKPTPFSNIEPYPGVEIHATMISNLLQGHALIELHPAERASIIALLIFLPVILFRFLDKITHALILIGVIFITYQILAIVGFYEYRIWIPLIQSDMGILAGFTAGAVVRYRMEADKKRMITDMFSRYVSKDVVQVLTSHPDKLHMGGEEVIATVLFSDIKNFTNISEKLSPTDLVAHLNHYFSLCTQPLLDQNGLIDKYIGDAIMTVFGAPLNDDDHAAHACSAALDIQRIVKMHYEDKDPTSIPPFITRIGINTGPLVVGNIGSEFRTNYTVIGDSVNLASRLEGINKEFGTRIIISQSTYALVKDRFETRFLDIISVKGKVEPIRIYELIANHQELPLEDRHFYELFDQMVAHYQRRDFNTALALSEKCLMAKPLDIPSKIYKTRCEVYARDGVPDHWDGVFRFSTK